MASCLREVRVHGAFLISRRHCDHLLKTITTSTLGRHEPSKREPPYSANLPHYLLTGGSQPFAESVASIGESDDAQPSTWTLVLHSLVLVAVGILGLQNRLLRLHLPRAAPSTEHACCRKPVSHLHSFLLERSTSDPKALLTSSETLRSLDHVRGTHLEVRLRTDLHPPNSLDPGLLMRSV